MRCPVCSVEESAEGLVGHVERLHVGRLASLWACGGCTFSSPDLRDALVHCLLHRHSPEALRPPSAPLRLLRLLQTMVERDEATGARPAETLQEPAETNQPIQPVLQETSRRRGIKSLAPPGVETRPSSSAPGPTPNGSRDGASTSSRPQPSSKSDAAPRSSGEGPSKSPPPSPEQTRHAVTVDSSDDGEPAEQEKAVRKKELAYAKKSSSAGGPRAKWPRESSSDEDERRPQKPLLPRPPPPKVLTRNRSRRSAREPAPKRPFSPDPGPVLANAKSSHSSESRQLPQKKTKRTGAEGRSERSREGCLQEPWTQCQRCSGWPQSGVSALALHAAKCGGLRPFLCSACRRPFHSKLAVNYHIHKEAKCSEASVELAEGTELPTRRLLRLCFPNRQPIAFQGFTL